MEDSPASSSRRVWGMESEGTVGPTGRIQGEALRAGLQPSLPPSPPTSSSLFASR